MSIGSDADLIREYLDGRSDEAFTGLVQRHVHLVHSVALRYTGNPQDAQDVTQAVFVILAQKAGSLRQRATLTGWLYEATRLTARHFLRTRSRRQAREHQALMQSPLNEPDSDSAWNRLAPYLEEAMTKLSEKERTLVALRFFENKSFAETSALLGIQEWAARKRVERVVEKLRIFFAGRGIVVPATALTSAISANSVQAAPLPLAKSVAAAVLAKSTATSGSTITLVKGALKLMAWTKAKTAVVAGVGILLLTGTATITVKTIGSRNPDESWRVRNVSPMVVNNAAPQVRILPTKFSRSGGSSLVRPGIGIDKFVGINVPVSAIVSLAYRSDDPLGMPWPRERMLFSSPQPRAGYDFISTVPQGAIEALRRELKTELGFIAHREARDADVLLLKIKTPGASGLVPSAREGFGQFSLSGSAGFDHFKCDNQPLSLVASAFQQIFKMPVIDRTGLTQHFNIDLKYKTPSGATGGNDALKEAVSDQLGLEFVSSREPVEFLIVEKVN